MPKMATRVPKWVLAVLGPKCGTIIQISPFYKAFTASPNLRSVFKLDLWLYQKWPPGSKTCLRYILRYVWERPKILPLHVWYRSKICLSYTWDMSEICLIYVCDMPEIYLGDLPGICLRKAYDMANIWLRYAWDKPEIFLRYTWDANDIYLRYV